MYPKYTIIIQEDGTIDVSYEDLSLDDPDEGDFLGTFSHLEKAFEKIRQHAYLKE